MSGGWQSFDYYLPEDMPEAEAVSELRRRILIAAAERGDFVGNFQSRCRGRHSDGWQRWTAAYLAGPPRIGKLNHDMRVSNS